MTQPPSHILLVDDDVDFAESMADLLRSFAYEVTLAHSGEDALTLAFERPYDLVLMDMKMPGMDGIECMTRMRRIRPGIRVVMVTAFTHSEFIMRALKSGALGVLSKPVEPHELVKTVAFLSKDSSILMVEDDEDLAEELSRILEDHGYAVRIAPTFAEAQRVLERRSVDLLLLDFNLPDGTGAELLAWLAGLGRRQDALIITGYPDQALASLPCVSIRDVLVKPFEPETLLQAMRRHDHRQEAAR